MKKLLLVALLFATTLSTKATVLTVTNDGSGGSQYPSLLSAYNAAANGDTLMLEGTNVDYSTYTGVYPANGWDKSLTVIGIGFNPQKDLPRRTKITHNAYYGDAFYLYAGSSGSRFYGIEFTANVLTHQGMNNILFEDCKFNTHLNFNNVSSAGFAFVNCIFDNNNGACIMLGGSGNVVSNVQFSNCLFDGYVEGNNNTYSAMTFDHCLFLRTDGSAFNNIHFALVKNSVFMNFAPSATNTNWLNNMSTDGTAFHTLNGCTGSGNILSTNPNMVTYTLGNFYQATDDYHLQSGSPAIAAANDGTDIGIHGGYSKFSEKGEVLVTPIVRSMTINQTNAAPGATINVNIHASKPNDQ